MDEQIQFIDLPDYSPKDKELADWLRSCADIYNAQIEQLQYSFVSEEKLLSLNKTYLDHDTDTDIVTFSYAQVPFVEAEIYISTTRLEENAKKFNQTPDNELLRLLSHGFLHSIDYLDGDEDQKKIMREQEERCIQMFHVKHS